MKRFRRKIIIFPRYFYETVRKLQSKTIS